ncbi:helix-turn-helix domain-containing protein [Streptomyces sp. NPDC002888]|uniref:helix-turn-helix domain-containing protein n=1 Tax=Streptomyces sp. NPDC002888 TaxID=3364668 RepID=UPI0036B96A87
MSRADGGRRYRLYPKLDAARRLEAWGHTARALWNMALYQRIHVHEQRGVTLRLAGQGRFSTEIEARARWTSGSVTNSTRSTPTVRVPAQRGRRMREALPAAHGPQKGISLPRFQQ